MSSQDRLLSDEELREQLETLFNRAGLIINFDDEEDPTAQLLYESLIIFNTQKRLYAESVIGEDEPIPEFGMMSEKKLNRIELRAEQRARIK